MRVSDLQRLTFLLLFPIAVVFAGGCEKKNQYAAPPPPSVTVAKPIQKDVTDFLEFTGTTQAVASVDIRARVQGFLQSVHFKDGAVVKKGDLLYIIDPATYQASADKAEGDLAARKAQFDRAEVEYQRNLRLIKENATSERDLNNSKASRDTAKADVAVATANLENAKINLGYTTIRAPMDGKIGRSQVDVGNLVGAGEYTLLTTIKKYNPIYAYFTLNEHDLLAVMKMSRRESNKTPETEHVPVFLGLANDTGYPHEGELDFADLGVDQSTGTILLRGVFKNPYPHPIIPGLFVRLRVPLGIHSNALLVSERAIGTSQQGKYVLVVNEENTVEARPVQLGALDGGFREIVQGLKADDRVIINGMQRARPGSKVDPTPAAAAPAASSDKPAPAAKP